MAGGSRDGRAYGVTDSGKGTAMRKLIYSMSVSLDGFIAEPGGEIDWSAPDDELFRFHTEQVRELGGHLLGRRLYETMVYWETAEEQPSLPEPEREFARIWKELPKVVFSTDARDGSGQYSPGPGRHSRGGRKAEGGAGQGPRRRRRRARRRPDGARPDRRVPALRQPGRPRRRHAILSRRSIEKVDLELVETRTFGGRVVYLRYRRASD